MTNKLPEKLTSLRKNFGYAQGETATMLHIPVAVYMNWENGNSIPNMEQLKLISGLYRVPLQDLVDNTREIVLPEPEKYQDSVEIPFMSDTSSNSYAQSAPQETIQVPVEDDEEKEDAGDTRLMTTDQLQATKVNEIIDDDESEEPEDDDEEYEDEEDEDEDDEEPLGLGEMFSHLFHKNNKEDHSTENKKKKGKKDNTSNKTRGLLIAVAAAAVLLVVLLVRLLGGGGGSSYAVKISDVNRLALGDGFSMYLKGEGQLTTMGNAVPSLPADDLVQVSAGGTIAMGLKKDGTVVCTGSGTACNVDNWSQIKMIAAGTNHTVGLKEDGTVLCNGSENACNVSDWTDIDAVYAGNEITIGKKTDGTLLVSGDVSSSDRLTALKNVSSVSIGSNQIAVVNKDGTVACYAIGTDATSSTATWTDVTQSAVGGSFAAGLAQGKVDIATTDPDLSQAVSEWTNIKYIAARNNTLIAVASDDSIIGAGDNDTGVYGTNNSSASASASATSSTAPATDTEDNNQSTTGKLASPSGLKATANGKNIEVSWSEVTGANYYQVSIDSNPVQSIKANENHASFDSSKLANGQKYTISVTAYAGNNASNPATITLNYQASLAAPSNVTAVSSANGTSVTVNWSSVTGAEWYRVYLNGQKYGNDIASSSTSTQITGLTSGTEYAITVAAGAGYYDGGTYKENMGQQSAAVKVTPADTGSYTVTFQLSNNTSTTTSLKSGTGYKVSDYVTAPNGYHLKDASQTFDVSGKDATVQVALEQDAVSVTGFTFTLDKASIKVGETAIATAKVDPDNATNKSVNWSSDNTGIATVGSDGTVTGLAVGEANITGTTVDGNKTYSVKITVTAAE